MEPLFVTHEDGTLKTVDKRGVRVATLDRQTQPIHHNLSLEVSGAILLIGLGDADLAKRLLNSPLVTYLQVWEFDPDVIAEFHPGSSKCFVRECDGTTEIPHGKFDYIILDHECGVEPQHLLKHQQNAERLRPYADRIVSISHRRIQILFL